MASMEARARSARLAASAGISTGAWAIKAAMAIGLFDAFMFRDGSGSQPGIFPIPFTLAPAWLGQINNGQIDATKAVNTTERYCYDSSGIANRRLRKAPITRNSLGSMGRPGWGSKRCAGPRRGWRREVFLPPFANLRVHTFGRAGLLPDAHFLEPDNVSRIVILQSKVALHGAFWLALGLNAIACAAANPKRED